MDKYKLQGQEDGQQTLRLLGAWVLLSPLTFNYSVGLVQPVGREVWLPLDARILVLMFLGFSGLTLNRPSCLWARYFIGSWLTTASPAISLDLKTFRYAG